MADRTITVRIGANVTGLVAGMKTADKATQDFGRGWLATTEKNAAQIGTLTTKIGLLGGAMTAVGVLAVKKFMDFDAAMSQVAATGDDARASIEDLREAAIQAGADTQFSATQAADAITALAKAGVSAKNVLDGGLSGALDLAAASGMGVAEAAEIMATSMNQFQVKGRDASHVADLLAAAAGKAMGDVEDMAGAFKYVGPVAYQMGISIEETAGTIAYLAQQGVLGEQAGTSLRGMLTSLTSPSKVAAKEMKDLGINVYDAAGNFVGFDGVAQQLKSTMGDLTNAERDQALGRIFGNEQITTARLLYQGGAKEIDAWTAAVNDQGYAAEVAATKMDNLKGDLEKLSGSLETAFIGMGEGGNGPLRGLVQGLDDVVDGFNGLSDGVKQTALVLVGGGGLVLLGVAGMGKLAVATAETISAMKTMGIVSEDTANRMGGMVGKVGKWAGAIGLVVAGLEALNVATTKSAAGTNELSAMVDDLASSSDVAGDLFGDLLPKDSDVKRGKEFAAFLDDMANPGTWQTIGAHASDLGVSITRVFGDKSAKWSELEDRLSGVGDTLAQMAESDLSSASNAFRSLYDEAGGTEEVGKNLLKVMPGLRDTLIGLADGAGMATDDATLLKIILGDIAVASTDAADAEGALQASTEDTTFSIEDQTEALAELIEGQSKLAGIALSLRDAQRGLEAAYDAVTESIATNGTSLDIATEKGRANQEALDGIAQAGWDLITSMTANGSSQEELQATMQATRDRFIEVAQQFGISADEATGLANDLNLIPDNVSVTAQFDSSNADTAMQDFVNRWAGKTVTVQGIMDTTGLDRSMAASAARYTALALASAGKADGGAISGPGTGTSDTAGLYALSNGEHVLTASDVSKLGGQAAVYGLRAAIQNGSFKAPGMAAGGAVSRQYAAPTYITQAAAPSAGATYDVKQYITTTDPVAAGVAGVRHIQGLGA